MVAVPGTVGFVAETTATSENGCAAGPVGLIGVTTGRYVLPQPAIAATAIVAMPAKAHRAQTTPVSLEKSIIQFFPAYSVIVNQ
jgi:hypothetical protein